MSSANGMSREIGFTVPIAPSQHGDSFRHAPAVLRGTLLLPDAASGIVVLVTVSDSERFAQAAGLGERLCEAGLGCLAIDLLPPDDARYADAAQHVPLLTEHLLAVLARLAQQMECEALPEVPVGLLAAAETTPVAIRAAAIRDTTVRALVCAGGLVDLAGLQYLKELRAPLLMLLSATDEAATRNLSRARSHLPGPVSTATIPDQEAERTAAIATESCRWLPLRLKP